MVKALETEDNEEVAIIGVVWADAPIDYFVGWHKDIENFESGESTMAIKKISSPPRIEDFQTLSLPESDLDAIPKCRVGKCDVKVDEEALERLQSEVVWSAPDAYDQAIRLIREMAFQEVQTYLEGGDGTLGAYRDKKRPTFIDKEFDKLLASSPYLIEYIPEFHHYLDDFPEAELRGSEEFLYWSLVEFGLKPLLRLNHVVFYSPEEGENTSKVIASKMLYASHYFHTGLELKFTIRDSARPDAEGFYLISLNRSRSDGLTGFFGSIVRTAAQSAALKGLASALDSLKTQLEPSAAPRF